MTRTTEELLKDADEMTTLLSDPLFKGDKIYPHLHKLISELSTKLREREWQDISEVVAEEDMRIIGCTIPKITKAGHEIGCYDMHILSTYEDKWNGWVWHRENGDLFFPTHCQPLPTPPKKEQADA